MRKGLLIACAFLLCGWCLGQEPVKEFIDRHGRVVTEHEDASGYRLVVRNAKGKLNGPVTEYDNQDRKIMSGSYGAGDREGLFEHYHPNGQVASKLEYRADLPVGRFESWYKNGKPQEVGNYPGDTAARTGKWLWEVYRIESFWDSTGVQLVTNGSGEWHGVHDNGKVSAKGAYRGGLREGEWTFYDQAVRLTNAERYANGHLKEGSYQGPGGDRFAYTSETYEIMPEYPGGIPALSEYLSNTLRYPKEARRQRVNGTVFVGFIVEADGEVSDVHVLKGIHEACDAEAIRAIEVMPRWQAGRKQGRPVSVRYSVPIRFSTR